VDDFLTRVGPSAQARLALVSRGSNFDAAMAATIYRSASPAETPREARAAPSAPPIAEARGLTGIQWASEKVLSASDETRIADLSVGVVVLDCAYRSCGCLPH
jgi:hypothetical protein